MIVVDASMAATWVLPDEQNELSETLLDRVEAEGGIVPSLFWHEIRNILLKVERRGRTKITATSAALPKLRRLALEIIADGADSTVLTLARSHKLSAYDAAYLEIAIRQQRALATADRRLAVAAHAAGIVVLGPYAAIP